MSSSERTPRRTRSPRRRHVFLLAVVVIVVAVVAGVAVTRVSAHATRDTVAPIEWRGAEGGAQPVTEMRIRLQRDGRAEVIDAPRGEEARQNRDEARQNRNGRRHLCFKPSAAGEYTGPATWEPVGEWGIRVRFETSSLILRAGKGDSLLPDPDWNRPRMKECGKNGRTWHFDRVD